MEKRKQMEKQRKADSSPQTQLGKMVGKKMYLTRAHSKYFSGSPLGVVVETMVQSKGELLSLR